MIQGTAVAEKDPARDGINEIRDLVEGGDLSRAVRRLLDYSRDFTTGRSLENEAVALSARFHSLGREIRQHGSTSETDAKHTRLLNSLLELTDEIYKGYEAPGPEAPGPLLTMAELGPAPQPEQSVKPPVTPPTSIEGARARFLQGRRRSVSEAPHPGDVAFFCRDLRHSYGKRSAEFRLSDLNLEVRCGEITGLVGVNGSGKTTLLRIIAGELSARAAEFSYPLLSPGSLDWPVIRHHIAYVDQSPPRWYGRLAENLHLSAVVHGCEGQDNRDEVDFILHRLGLERYRDHTWSQISGGFKMRFELARALLSKPKLLILDEPLAPLDIITQQIFLQDLRDLANSISNPLPILVSSQHLYEIETIADQLLFLGDGRPLYYGKPDELGRDQPDNLFELSCALSRAELARMLDSLPNLSVEEFGEAYNVRVAKSVSGSDVLRELLNADVEVKHFRDVSRSTRRLFDTKEEPL